MPEDCEMFFWFKDNLEEALQRLQELKQKYTDTERDLFTSGTANSAALETLEILNTELHPARMELAELYEKRFKV